MITLSDIEIKNYINMKQALKLTKEAFITFAQKESLMPEKVYVELKKFNGDFRAMPCYEHSQGFAGIKWVNVHPDNKALGLPTVMGHILLSDPKTGQLLANMAASEITAIRTGAVAGLAADYMSPKDAKHVCLIGAGKQSIYQLEALCLVRDVNHVVVYDKDEAILGSFKEGIARFYKGSLEIVSSIEAGVKHADIIVSSTPSTKAILYYEDLPRAVHINAIGADAAGKQELDAKVLKHAQLVVDDLSQAIHAGELNTHVTRGDISPSNVKGCLGDLILNKFSVDPLSLSVFDSTGLAIQDLALAGYIYKQAKLNKKDSLFE